MKKNFEKMRSVLTTLLLAVFVVSLTSCEDTKNDDTTGGAPFDPTKAVAITKLVPSSGGVGDQVIILGSNFGNDVSKVSVYFGGKKAVVVSCCDDAIYCYVPSKSMSSNNEVKVIVTDGTVEKEAKVETVRDEYGNPIPGQDNGFEYERNMVVGTLCGYKLEDDRQKWIGGQQGAPFRGADGTFESGVAGFRNDGVMQFSPYNHDHLFVVYDQEPNWEGQHAIQLIDLKEEMVYDVLTPNQFDNIRLRTIDFVVDPFAYEEDGSKIMDYTGSNIIRTFSETDAKNVEHVYCNKAVVDEYGDLVYDNDGQIVYEKVELNADQKKWKEHLIVAVDKFDSNLQAPSIYIVDRDAAGNFSAGSVSQILASYQACNGAYQHPVNKEVYFNNYNEGLLFRLDMDKYWDNVEAGNDWDPVAKNNFVDATSGSKAFTRLFRVADNSEEMQIDIHPEGDYAYIVMINRNYILRTDYDWSNKTFTAPYVVCGQRNSTTGHGDNENKSFVDGVGQSALLARPYQGTFVKNDLYVEEGRSDHYDFYFCDSYNDALRYLTPEGIVRTYAGGGGKQGNADGTYADGMSWGSENGELLRVARFHRCTGLVNDVHKDKVTGLNTLIFYILDTINCRIRTITMEEPDDDEPVDEPNGGDDGGEVVLNE